MKGFGRLIGCGFVLGRMSKGNREGRKRGEGVVCWFLVLVLGWWGFEGFRISGELLEVFDEFEGVGWF